MSAGNVIPIKGEDKAIEQAAAAARDAYLTAESAARDAFLDHVRFNVAYWAGEDGSNVSPDLPKREALEGLAFSIMVALDGGGDVAYAVIPIPDGDPDDEHDEMISISGELHERLW